MGYYEDHIEKVAERMAEKMKDGKSEEAIRRLLSFFYWDDAEVEAIIKRAKQIKESGKLNEGLTKITAKVFKQDILLYLNERDVYFAQTREYYYAQYQPHYPVRTNGDFLISLNHIKGELNISQFYEPPIPPFVRKFNSWYELLLALRYREEEK